MRQKHLFLDFLAYISLTPFQYILISLWISMGIAALETKHVAQDEPISALNPLVQGNW